MASLHSDYGRNEESMVDSIKTHHFTPRAHCSRVKDLTCSQGDNNGSGIYVKAFAVPQLEDLLIMTDGCSSLQQALG